MLRAQGLERVVREREAEHGEPSRPSYERRNESDARQAQVIGVVLDASGHRGPATACLSAICVALKAATCAVLRFSMRFSAPQWIRTTDLVLLLAECVCARPVVLAPLALRASGTLNAGRGAKARRARRRVLRAHLGPRTRYFAG